MFKIENNKFVKSDRFSYSIDYQDLNNQEIVSVFKRLNWTLQINKYEGHLDYLLVEENNETTLYIVYFKKECNTLVYTCKMKTYIDSNLLIDPFAIKDVINTSIYSIYNELINPNSVLHNILNNEKLD